MEPSHFSIAGTRSHVLKIRLPDKMWIHDLWLWGQHDDQDQLFFLQGDTIGDAASLRLGIESILDTKDGPVAADFESMVLRTRVVELESVEAAV